MKSHYSKTIRLVALSIITLFFASCVKEIDEYQKTNTSNSNTNSINDLSIPSSMDYSLEKVYQINIQMLTNDNSPIKFAKVKILDEELMNSGKELYTGITDNNGIITCSIKVAKSLTQVYVCSNYIGIPNNIVINLNNNNISLVLGGANPQKNNFSTGTIKNFKSQYNYFKSTSIPNKVYLGTWSSNGVPSYLVPQKDIISSDLLNRINYSLPEFQSVPINHSNYLSSNANTNVLLTQQADVWMTFIHEGAGNKNTVGYYAYNKNYPPQSVSDINNIKIVFPNYSYLNSGGGLVCGDKVYLGSFGPDTIIGFVLLANAYNISTSSVDNGFNQFYSNSNLNPESNPNLKKHNIALWDLPTQKMIIGFEDLNRNGGDNDFNDAIFSITSNPISAISTDQVLNTTSVIDSDGDGVNNNDDEYPNDPYIATNSFYPSSTTFGHIAFEDLWPYRGDYDMNDLIVGYKFNTIKNGANEVVAIQSYVYVKAAGGSYQNGFGFELPFNQNEVSMVIGQNLQEGYINLNSNATEAGQNKAVIIAFDNATNLAKRPNGFYINTEIGSPIVVSDTIKVTVWLKNPLPASAVGSAPFNPFMICNKTRGKEIHLANMPPTSLADVSIFNTGNDKTNIALGRYYLSDKNIPWALNIPNEYPIVIEKFEIIEAYTKFKYWCNSGGTIYSDWYEDKPGYRDISKLLFR